MKKIFLALFVILSMFFVSCGSSDSVKEAINDTNDSTTKFSQNEIDYVNMYIEEMKQFGFIFTSTTINSTTMKVTGTYVESGNTISFSDKIEKTNGLVFYTRTNYTNSSDSYTNYEFTIPRVLSDFDSSDFFTSDENSSLLQFLSNNNLDNFSTGFYTLASNIFKLTISFNPYEGNIVKDNNKYYFIDETGIIATENSLSDLIANTSLKSRLNSVILKNIIGTYSGTYSGGDTGTWNITINSDGSITGTTTSYQYGPFSVTGTLNGNTATLTATSGATLTTTIDPTGIVSGSWTNADEGILGDLTGTKD